MAILPGRYIHHNFFNSEIRKKETGRPQTCFTTPADLSLGQQKPNGNTSSTEIPSAVCKTICDPLTCRVFRLYQAVRGLAIVSEMPKRKRGEDGVGQHEASGSATVLQKRAEEKIFHGRKVVQRSLKVAKGFERQKLARRQKTATQEKKEDEIARINNEIEALKVCFLPAQSCVC